MFLSSGGVPVDPGIYFAFFPSQVLTDPVSGEFPFPPFLADGTFRHREYCGYLARRQHPVRTAEGTHAGLRAPLVGDRFLFLVVV
jgi:hypothetical protein